MVRLVASVLVAGTLLSLPVRILGQNTAAAVDFSEVYTNVVSSVVYVETAEVLGAHVQPLGVGSGFVVHKDGYVVTAAHVVEEADVIRLTFHNQKQAEATIISMSRAQDLALLKVDKLPGGSTVARLADAAKLRPAQPIFCIGAPRNYRFSVTAGIVSAIREMHPSGYELHTPTRLIQTDVAINPGNSGGPIFNGDGEVVGVASQRLASAENIGFAVPSDLVRQHLIDEAIPFAGVVYLRLSAQDAAALNYLPFEAILVERVQVGSLAEKNGLRGGMLPAKIGQMSLTLGGDLIYKIGGHSLADMPDVRKYLRGLKKGDEITCTILRHGRLHQLKASFEILAPAPRLGPSSKAENKTPSENKAKSDE